MYKVIMDYEKINKNMKIKFGLILSDSDKKFNTKVLDKFNIDGTDYLKISPHPFLTIDIATKDDKKGNWSSNKSVSLTRIGLFIMKRRLRESIRNLMTDDLYEYYNGKLTLNKNMARDLTLKFRVNNKYVMIQPIVVPDEEDPNVEYEGLCIMINSVDNYNLVTVEEAEFLYDVLDKVDLTGLALQVINTAMLMKNRESIKLEIKSNRLITEEVSKENVGINFTNKKEEESIPNI